MIFGGLGNDVLHGGAGDDAISGAEAPLEGYAANMRRRLAHRGRPQRLDAPVQPRRPAALRPARDRARPRRFALFDGAHPYTKMLVNGQRVLPDQRPDARAQAPGRRPSDGEDRDRRRRRQRLARRRHRPRPDVGGIGNDLLDGDDDPNTDGGLNIRTDDNPDYADHGDGGAGRDILLGNTAGDVLTDTDGNYDDLNAGWIGSGMPVGNPGSSGGGLIGGVLGAGSGNPGAGLLPGTGPGKSAGSKNEPGAAPTKLSAATRRSSPPSRRSRRPAPARRRTPRPRRRPTGQAAQGQVEEEGQRRSVMVRLSTRHGRMSGAGSPSNRVTVAGP